MTDSKTAIVTGGRRGIGSAIAIALAREGFNILIVDVVNDSDAAKTRVEIEKLGLTSGLLIADIANRDDHVRILEMARSLPGQLTVLVNNAGVSSIVRGDLLNLSEESFDRAMRVNLRGTFFLTQAFAKYLIEHSSKESRGFSAVINITSINAEVVAVNRGDYCISKAGLSMMTKLYGARLASENINVYEIRPGMIRTQMTAVSAASYDQFLQSGGVPIARWGEPDDVGKAAAMLAAGHLDFSTGSVIFADGAMGLHRI